jgi:hypothetical protein
MRAYTQYQKIGWGEYSITEASKRTSHAVGLAACMATLLASCTSAQLEKPKSLGASVRSINYSGKEVQLTVADPLDKSNRSGGDALNPYGSGGTICCFRIPADWVPGYKVIVKYSIYPDQTWHEQLVDVPPYAGGIAGDIWLAMHEDGRAEAVVSTFGPTRPEWPGRVKGRPVASKEYMAKVKQDSLLREKSLLVGMEQALKDGTGDLTPEQIDRLKRAIESTRKRILLMGEDVP